MDTKLSVLEIQRAIANYFEPRKNIIVPNVSFGLLSYEADMLVLNRSGYLTEVEIKRSWSDFMADFKKKHKHNDRLVKFFYYAVPRSILEKVEAVLNEKEIRCGLLVYFENCSVSTAKKCGNVVYDGRKLFIEEQLQLARLGTMRLWK
jgi:hypothetical protein